MNALESLLQAIQAHRKELVAVVVHLNDTYLIEERPERKLPGFGRLIATVDRLRAYVEKTVGPDHFLVVHSGDFLGPSLLAKYDKGRAMVELLEKVGLDYCVLGNHEFDHKAETLAERVNGKKFKVLIANATDPTGLVSTAAGAWWPADQPIVALTGVVSESVAKSFESPDLTALLKKDPVPWRVIPASEALIPFLESSRDALFRIVLSHSTQDEDRQLRRQIPPLDRTYILGGHDHDIEWIEDDRDVFVMKNLANAESVRVLLLLSGGESVVRDVLVRNQRLQERRRAVGKNDEAANTHYPQDMEAVLLMTSDRDCTVIRDRIAQAEGTSGPFDDLAEALTAAHYKPDLLTTKLLYKDHEPPAQVDFDYIAQALKRTEARNDRDVIRDFTACTGKLEARDSHIRRQPTNFGMFVADCLRRHARADVAIINSGAFRCDSELDPKLHVRDLRETFLFDTDDAIMVLDLDSAVVQALLEHGRSKSGSGAYPQVSSPRKDLVGEVSVAIASYLLTRRDSTDGYDEILRREWASPSVDQAREDARAAASRRFRIIEAVEAEARNATFVQSPGSSSQASATLINLLKAYTEAFHEEFENSGSGLHRQFPSAPERSRVFRHWLGTDAPPVPSSKIEAARKGVRAFLRTLPSVAAHANPGTSSWDEMWSKAEKELRTIQTELASHDFVFRDRANYAWLFDLAARGMPGWRSFPD